MKVSASLAVTFNTFVLLITIPVFLMEKLNHKIDRSHNARHTNHLLFAVLIPNTLYQVWCVILAFVCAECKVLFITAYITRSVAKGANLMFLIHRAKLAQGMDPLFSIKWFEKVFPSCIAVYTTMLIGFTIYGVGQEVYHCESYSDADALQICRLGHDGDAESHGIAAMAIGWDLLITTFLITLFVVPLYRVYKADLGILNANQLRQRGKLKRLLIWSIMMTFINQVTSAMAVANMVYESNVIYAVWVIGQSDPAFNVWTSWLMISRNRQFVAQSLCRDQIQEHASRAASVLSDIPSTTNHSRFLRMITGERGDDSIREINDVELKAKTCTDAKE